MQKTLRKETHRPSSSRRVIPRINFKSKKQFMRKTLRKRPERTVHAEDSAEADPISKTYL